MASTNLVLNHLNKLGRFSLWIVAGLLLFIWGLETPAGILGKADAIGYAVCHRIDLRSFHIGLQQMPLCARCTGQYVGAMIGLLFQVLYARHRSGFPPKRVLVVLAILSLLYMVDGLNSYFYLPPFLKATPWIPHLYVPSNMMRLLTGSGMGLVIAAALYPAFVGSIITNPDLRLSLGGLKPLFCLIGLISLADLLILKGSSYVLYSAALVSAGGVIALLSMVYMIVLLHLFKRVNKSGKLSQVGMPLLGGFFITMLQIAIFDLIRFIITGTWSGLIFK